jgi:uncharacterized protein (TIGR02246 family)
VLSAIFARAQNAQEANRADDQAAIRKCTDSFLQAVAKGDAKAVAAFWAPTGEYVQGDAAPIRGRDDIEKAYTEYFKAKQPAAVELQNDSIRFLADEAVLEEGDCLTKQPNPAERSRHHFSILYVRDKGKWSIAQLRQSPDGPGCQELAWLIGTWNFKTDDATTRITFEWNDQKTFLIGRFTTKQPDRTTSGLQIVALDPATRSLRSWSFESDGSIGVAAWSRTDKGWTAKARAVTADGEKVNATTMLQPSDDNHFTWSSTDRTIDGEKAPDIGPITMVREGTAP